MTLANGRRRLRAARSRRDLRRLRRRPFLPPIVTGGAPPIVSRPPGAAELSGIVLLSRAACKRRWLSAETAKYA
jgi:hypothetical protein